MKPYRVVSELHHPKAEPFAVLAVDPSVRVGEGVLAVVVSLHWTREEAERAVEGEK